MEITPDKEGALAVTHELWQMLGLPTAALDRLTLEGDEPLLPSSFHVGVAALSSIAAAALAAEEYGRRRSGEAQQVRISMMDAELECTGFFKLDGKAPDVWAPLSGLYPCKDGHVRIHANFDHHRDGALRLLKLGNDPAGYTKADVTVALSDWKAEAFESAAADAGLVVSAIRHFNEWDEHPHAPVIAASQLIELKKIGEADPIQPTAMTAGQLPLTGVRVLDLTRILAGPVCGRTLAAYGADVMLVNAPHLPNIESIVETSRGKLSTLLDVRNSADAVSLMNLVEQGHVFVQGYRPGALQTLGFDPQTLAARRPGIVYVSLSAYGNQGPWAGRRGFDSLVQSATGFNLAEAEAAGNKNPQALPVQILDYASGFLMAYATAAALIRQEQEGGSWHVDISLARTAEWLRSLGRIPYVRRTDPLDIQAYSRAYPCIDRDLHAMPHAARFSRTPPTWQRPSAPPGHHKPVWP